MVRGLSDVADPDSESSVARRWSERLDVRGVSVSTTTATTRRARPPGHVLTAQG